MDDNALRKVLAKLRSFNDNLPNSQNIQEKYIVIYHDLLKDLAQGSVYLSHN
jgi:hypothetical protein